MSSLQFSRVGDQELAWIDGVIDKSEAIPFIDSAVDKVFQTYFIQRKNTPH